MLKRCRWFEFVSLRYIILCQCIVYLHHILLDGATDIISLHLTGQKVLQLRTVQHILHSCYNIWNWMKWNKSHTIYELRTWIVFEVSNRNYFVTHEKKNRRRLPNWVPLKMCWTTIRKWRIFYLLWGFSMFPFIQKIHSFSSVFCPWFARGSKQRGIYYGFHYIWNKWFRNSWLRASTVSKSFISFFVQFAI